jgi:hypothetical protein
VAGQDKRSVLQQTDLLCSKNYIIKDTEMLAGLPTSRLTLSRFALPTQIATASQRESAHNGQNGDLTVRGVVERVIAVFATEKLVDAGELASTVGISGEGDPKTLMRILRTFVRSGYLKKVKAAVGTFAHTGEPRICYQRLRNFDENDLSGFADSPTPLDKTIADDLEDPEGRSAPAVEKTNESYGAQWNRTDETSPQHPESHDAMTMDKFGFPLLNGKELLHDGGASLLACARTARAEDLTTAEQSFDEPQPKRQKRRHNTDDDSAFKLRETPSRKTQRPYNRTEKTVIGRPRKFLRGTEKFWQHHFWHARLEAEGGFAPEAGLRGGTASHPAGTALFESRPDGFDEVLLQAKQAGLPLPRAGNDISEAWVRRTREVLERRQSCAYVTPVGMHLSRVLHKAQVLVVKSKKLGTLDLSDQVPKVYAYRFLTSSAAHSFQNWRWFPAAHLAPEKGRASIPRKLDVEYPPDVLTALKSMELDTPDAGSRPPKIYAYRFLTSSAAHSFQKWLWSPTTHKAPKKGKRSVPRKLDVEYPPDLLVAFGKVPRAGVFLEPLQDPSTPRTTEAVRPTISKEQYDMLMDETEVDSDVEQRLKPKPVKAKGVKASPGAKARAKWQSATVTALVAPVEAVNQEQPASEAVEQQSPVRKTRTSRSPYSVEQVVHRLSLPESRRPTRLKRLTQKAAESMEVRRISNIGSPVVSIDGDPHEDGDADDRQEYVSDDQRSSPPVAGTGTDVDDPLKGILATETPAERTPSADDEPNPAGGGDDGHSGLSAESVAIPETHVTSLLRPLAPRTGPYQPPTTSPLILTPPASDTALKRRRDSSQSHESATSSEGPPKKVRKPGSRSQIDDVKEIIIELLKLNNSVGPGCHVTIRRASGAMWMQRGFAGLPNLTTAKRAMDRLVGTGKVKKHTFSYRDQSGATLKKHILYLPTVPLADTRIESLKAAMAQADKQYYFPDIWTDFEERSTNKTIRGVDETFGTESNVEDQLDAPNVAPRKRRRRTSSSRSGGGWDDDVSDSGDPIERSPRPRVKKLKAGPATSFVTLNLKGSAQSTTLTGISTSRESSVDSSSASISSTVHPNSSFLTLNVGPRLASLPQVQEFNAKLELPDHLRSPVRPIAAPTTPNRRRAPRRKPEDLRKDVFRKADLPESLAEILREQGEAEIATERDQPLDPIAAFFKTVGLVEKWEHRLASKLTASKVPWCFINHTCTIDDRLMSPPASWILLQPTSDGKFAEEPILIFDSWAPFAQQRLRLGLSSGLDSAETAIAETDGRVTRQATGSLKRKRTFDFYEHDIAPLGRKKFRKDVDADADADVGFESEEDAPREKRPYNRKPRTANDVEAQYATLLSKTSTQDIYRIGATVTLVSVLAGGKQQTINWKVVDQMNPGWQLSWIKPRWTAIHHLHRDGLSTLATNLRHKYVDAVEEGSVPLIDLTSPAENDWEEFFEWMQSTLPSFVVENALPSTKAELGEEYGLTFDEPSAVNTATAPSHSLKSYEREERVSGVSFSTQRPRSEPTSDIVVQARSMLLSSLVAAAKSNSAELRSNVITTLTSLSTDENAREQAVASALVQLQADKLVAKADSTVKRSPTLIEKREFTYTLTNKFSEQLGQRRTYVNLNLLNEATAYKLDVLDSAFLDPAGQSFPTAPTPPPTFNIPNQANTSNGQMLALLNLAHAGMLSIRPGKGSMKSRYGVSWEKVGYQTRQIDQADLGFDVEIVPTARYQYGLPAGVLSESDDIQPPMEGSSETHWPIWRNMLTGGLDHDLWDKVLAAVVGIVHLRPGAPNAEIQGLLGGFLTGWEVDLVLGWALKRGFVRKTIAGNGEDATGQTQDGWQTGTFWWWCCFRRDAK